jgi:uncharacterized protein YlbG (UPF0298 family)
MTKVNYRGPINYGVRFSKRQANFNVLTKTGISMARSLSDLSDVDISNKQDKFVLMYNNLRDKWEAKNPDDVLIAAAITETTQPGLPEEFMNYLKENLETDAASELFAQLQAALDELTISDLSDVNDEGRRDKYLLMFNELLQEYRSVNPDEVLRASVTEPEEPGLPDELLDQLDEDLDNRIDFDGGEY